MFSKVERAIVLEDDCLAHPDFFRFCSELLERYADDERVSVITGNNFQKGLRRGDASYYFSKYNHCWGWASWRRAWQHYQGNLPFWPEWVKSDDWRQKMSDSVERRYWSNIFERVSKGQTDSWAYPWTGCVWYHGGLTATPNVNLVSNIGFGSDSTHTASVDSPLAKIATKSIGEISHPSTVEVDVVADRFDFDHTFGGRFSRFPLSILRIPSLIAGFLYRRIKGFFS
jgi:hypothetical protein